jgi:glycosyltransferase involved in cell wall biosynthesis
MSAERMLGVITDRFIAVSESERREIIDEGIAQSGRVDVVYPRIDAAYYCPREQGEARRELRLPQGVPIVLGIGRLAPQKDPLSFVSAIARLRATMPTAIGIWVGDGELRNQVEAAARRLRLGEGLQIAGWISDVRPHIAACDVLLSTSRYESFGYAVAESFAMERPAVASRVTGTVDVFYPAAESLLYPAGALDEAVTRLTRLLNDKALRKELGGLGRSSMIENFSGAAMYRALSSSYRAALS